MKRRKLFAIMAAMLSLFLVAGIASAQDQVRVSVTSEPIQQDATCDKAGGFSLSFDSNTQLLAGDVITIDLDLGVTLCREIDLEISNGGSDGVWDETTVMGNSAADPIYYVDDITGTAGDLAEDPVLGGVYFRVYGADNSARITVTVMGPAGASLQVGADPGDELVLKFLGQRTNATFVNDGIYIDDDNDGTYDVAAELADNTICIDISDPTFLATKVQGNMDSSGDKFTFIPSNPQIAHVVSPHAYAFYTQCKGRNCGEVVLGSTSSTQFSSSEDCISFDNEITPVAAPYCTAATGINVHAANNLIITRTDGTFDTDDYTITLTILVNGVTGDNGVYFSNEDVGVTATNNASAACAYTDDSGVVELTPNYAAGITAAPQRLAGGSAPNAPDCDVALTARATTLTTDSDSLGITGSENALWIDLPAFNYDLAMVSDGDVVTVEVILTKAPCGELFKGEWCVATLVDACTTAAATIDAGELLYPYFTAMSGDSWWDGLVVDNLTSLAGTFTATIYEQDGDQGTFTSPTVNGNSSYIALLSNMVGSATPASGNTGTLGDSPCYILVCTSWGTADGFAMIGSSLDSAVNGSETMGYLPRTNSNMCP